MPKKKEPEVSQDYIDRLSDWVEVELEDKTTTQFAAAIARANGVPNFSSQMVRDWLRKKIKTEIRSTSLAAIARYRGWSTEQTLRWLRSGVEPLEKLLPEFKPIGLLPSSQARNQYSESIDTLEAAEKLLFSAEQLVWHLRRDRKMSTRFSEFIQAEFDRKGKSPFSDDDFHEFAEAGKFADYPEVFVGIRAVCRGEAHATQNLLPVIATALGRWTRRSYDSKSLLELIQDDVSDV